jgi:catechol 2,3-dioxygenase-like lactoylglutathione lyase family enzyme
MASLGMVTLVVPDYDPAIKYFTKTLGFTLIENTAMPEGKRWVVIETEPQGARLLLAKATTPSQQDSIGNSTGGRVAFFLYTQEFDIYYQELLEKGVKFTELPRNETFGKVVVFKDLYGNKWDLIEQKN